MIEAYSQRIMPPYSGVVQIAETARGRAQSFDGKNWDIHYLPLEHQSKRRQKIIKGYSLDRSFYRVAHFRDKQLKTYSFPNFLDRTDIDDCIRELSEFIESAELPFPSADHFECWLLDPRDESPLAMIFSCCDESLIDSFPSKAEWTALPHSKMYIENTDDEDERNVPAVNHRFQRMIANRAGMNPVTAWVEKTPGPVEGFPGFLVTQDWHSLDEQDICRRYLERKSPRLLMLNSLTFEEREQMEIAAKKYVAEVEEYYAVYPFVNDESRLSAMRVEARLRRDMPSQAVQKNKTKKSKLTPFSKDMRILE